MAGYRTNVFFSHSSKDAVWVGHLAEQAKACGVDVYLAEHDVSVGDQLSTKVRQAIGRSNAVMVLITPNSWQSPFVLHEIGAAVNAGKFVIPVVTPDAASLDMGFLQGLEYIALDPDAPQDAFSRLTHTLTIFASQREAAARRQAFLAAVAVAALLGLMMLAET